MEKLSNYMIGLDIGIGSVGWSVMDYENGKINDFGVRIFDSGENIKDRDRDSQKRRGFRSQRRQIRRRHHRKERLKFLLSKFGITTIDKLNSWYKDGNAISKKIDVLGNGKDYRSKDIYALRAIGLENQLTGEELAAVLLHICNHRGYKAFYDTEETEEDSLKGVNKVEEIMNRNRYKTVGEMYAKSEEFANPNENFKNFSFVHNAKSREEHYIVTRSQTEKEVKLILDKQQEFFKCLNEKIAIKEKDEIIQKIVKERIIEIMFSQRDFEDGPGESNSGKNQYYKGFADSIGNCMYYKDEKRGARCSLIGDLYAIINLLSQYKYLNSTTGEINMPPDAAKEIIDYFINNGEISDNSFKVILKKYDTIVNTKKESNETFSHCNKFTKKMKSIIEKSGLIWNEFCKPEQLDINLPSELHKLSEVLATNITPERRECELKKLSFLNHDARMYLKKERFGGTSNLSNKFMCESIEAFINGEIYGNFQARKLSEQFEGVSTEKHEKLQLICDDDMIKNPVVFRSLNETRKIVNAIIERNGTPSGINVEIASDLNRSFKSRDELSKTIKNNEKTNNEIKKTVALIKNCDITSVSSKDVDKYKLYEQQEHYCLYSNAVISNVENIFSSEYEIDHIVPYSLILDNTLNNKCLVLRQENQLKRQRSPLQYFREENFADKEAKYKARVNAIYQKNKSGKGTLPISKTKYAYLMLESINSKDSEEILNQWKSRNINDTRYIAKYAVGMLQKLKLINNGVVMPIKGGITSKFRKWWLVNGNSSLECFQTIEKALLHNRKAMEYLDKTLSEQISKINESEIKADEKKKQREKIIRQINAEKLKLFDKYIIEMKRKYDFDEEYSKELLLNNMLEKNRELTNLHHGVDAIIIGALNRKYIELASDNNKLLEIWRSNNKQKTKEFYDYLDICKNKMKKYYFIPENETEEYLTNPKKIPCKFERLKDEILVRTIDSNEELFRRLSDDLYCNIDFTSKLSMPIVSAKPERKLSGAITTDMPLKKEQESNKTFKKKISADNSSILDARKYYCTEIFINEANEACLRGIRFVDIVNKNKKIFLNCPYPNNYKQHLMYIFTNDFIELIDKKGMLKFSGYFRFSSILTNSNTGTTQQVIKGRNANSPETVNNTLSKTDTVKKINIDILGRKGGEIKCGVPLLLISQS